MVKLSLCNSILDSRLWSKFMFHNCGPSLCFVIATINVIIPKYWRTLHVKENDENWFEMVEIEIYVQ
jgi:hypothetical protein